MPNLRKSGRWSRKHDRCVVCKTIESPHKGKGVCYRCVERMPDRIARRRAQARDHARAVRDAALAGKWSKDRDCCKVRGRSDVPHAAWGRCQECKDKPRSMPFPRVGAKCVLVCSGEVGDIVGYAETYDEWRVRIPGEEPLLWESCDIAPYEFATGGAS